MKMHAYHIRVDWAGNGAEGTTRYDSYRRDHTIAAPGKAAIQASSDPGFRGDATRHNPEELLVASLSSCHMLWYLHLCSVSGVRVLTYVDDAAGCMEEDEDGSGRFVRVLLKPVIHITADSDRSTALRLHGEAHHRCFIANSVNFPVEVTPEIVSG